MAEPSLPPGRLLAGRFRLGRNLGAGGMGAVYEGRDERDGRAVALKVLHSRFAADGVLLERLAREERALAQLHHPNVVRVHGLFDDAGDRFIAMELLTGKTLHERLATGPLAVDETLAILEQILSGLEAAHARGIVHRDLKPANIFILDGSGVVKILDFGVVKFVAEGASRYLTRTGMVIGTAEYMAPEQAAGEPVDERTDLYAVGCVAFALLVGRPPFCGAPALQVMTSHLFDPPPSLASLRPELRLVEPLDRFLSRTLHKEPSARFQTAKEMRAAVTRLGLQLGEPAPSLAPTAPTLPRATPLRAMARATTRDPYRVSAAGVVASALAGLALAAVIAYLWLG
jgi:serine/threonine-protein kinase